VTRRTAALGLLFCAGCQYVSGVDDLKIQSDVADSAWGCLDTRDSRVAPASKAYADFVTLVPNGATVENVVARVCANDDATCAEPLLPPIHAPDGRVEFEVAGNFNGYIELESPDTLPGVVELWRPIGQMRVLPEMKVIRAETLQAFAVVSQVTVEPELGHAMFWAENCLGERAAGVVVRPVEGEPGSPNQLVPGTHAYYAVDGRLPSVSVGATDASGAGGVINLRPTYWTFEASLAADHRHVATFAARIRPGQVTVFIVEPD
jgi:hypothetical protein